MTCQFLGSTSLFFFFWRSNWPARSLFKLSSSVELWASVAQWNDGLLTNSPMATALHHDGRCGVAIKDLSVEKKRFRSHQRIGRWGLVVSAHFIAFMVLHPWWIDLKITFTTTVPWLLFQFIFLALWSQEACFIRLVLNGSIPQLRVIFITAICCNVRWLAGYGKPLYILTC